MRRYVLNADGKVAQVNARILVEVFFYNLLHYGARPSPRKPSARSIKGAWWGISQSWQEHLNEYDETARQQFARTWEALKTWASNAHCVPLDWGKYQTYADTYTAIARKWMPVIFEIDEAAFIATHDVKTLIDVCRAVAYQLVEQWASFKAAYNNAVDGKPSSDDDLLRKLFGDK